MNGKRNEKQAAGSASVMSCVPHGIEAFPVTVTATVGGDGPNGLFVNSRKVQPTALVRSSSMACGFSVPHEHVEVDFAPRDIVDLDVRHGYRGLDLAVVLAYLAATGQVEPGMLEEALVVGQLAPDGSVVSGAEAYAAHALAERLGARLVTGRWGFDVLLDRFELHSLSDLKDGCGLHPPTCAPVRAEKAYVRTGEPPVPEEALDAVSDAMQEHGSVLIVGGPSSAKRQLALWAHSQLPEMSEKAVEEAALVRSACGIDPTDVLQSEPPLRSPHHTVSLAGLLGGGRPVTPGECSLAHGGLLLLEDVQEFMPSVLLALRQPVRERSVIIQRAAGTYVFPADFGLVMTASPCPCGHFGDPDAKCICSASMVRKYREKLRKSLDGLVDDVVELAGNVQMQCMGR